MRNLRFVSIFSLSIIIFFLFVYFLYTEVSSYAVAHKSFQRLQAQVAQLRRDFSGQSSFIIKDIKKPFLEISYRESEKFPAASLIKLPIAVVTCNAIKEKKVKLWQVFTISAKDVAPGSGIIKTMRLPQAFTLKKIIELMIAYSDNTATNKIIDILGYGYINAGFRQLGLKNTELKRKMMDFFLRHNGKENYTSASDISYLLEKTYAKKLIDAKSSRMIMSFLLKQKVRDRIPRYLPKQLKVAHKTGLEKGVVHDAGIIFSPQGGYIVCVLTKGVKRYSEAKRFIAKLSLAAYNSLYLEDN